MKKYKNLDDFECRSLLELTLYVLSKKRYTILEILKTLYFAQQNHLLKWGRGISTLEFEAWKNGPVIPIIYHTLNHLGHGNYSIDKLFNEAIDRGKEDAISFYYPKREPDLNYLSQSEIEAIDQAVFDNKDLSVWAMRDKSQDKAWKEAFNKGQNSPMTNTSIARAAGADEDLTDHIANNEWINSALKY